LLLALAPLLPICQVPAQVYTGSLTGVVTDPAQAVIPGAKVAVIDAQKGYEFTAATDGSGRFVVRNLPPGVYRLKVTAPGFRDYVRENIVLSVNQNASVDVEMIVAGVTESVEVTAQTPLLATQDAQLGTAIGRKLVNDLPLVGRNVLHLVYLAPGITPAARFPYTSTVGNRGNNFTSNGARNNTASVIVDGVTVTAPEPNSGVTMALYTPPVDAVQELKVEQNNLRADIGWSGNTAVNIVTRSGTNEFHGTVYEFAQSSALNANGFFSNKYGAKKPVTNNHTFGGVVGGPIQKNKTFFFFFYNGGTSRSASSTTAGVPSEAMRQGDFGEICTAGFDPHSGRCADPEQQLWDPFTGVYDARQGGPVRSTFVPFNNLAKYMSPGPTVGSGSPIKLPARPGNLIDPVSAKMMSYFPKPNINPATPLYNRFRNYFANTSGKGRGNEVNVRIDHRFTERDLLSGKYAHGWGTSSQPPCFDSIMDPCANRNNTSKSNHASLNYNRTLSPVTILTVNLGFAQSRAISPGPIGSYPDFSPVKDLGLPEYILRSGYRSAPNINYGDSGYLLGQIGTKTWAIWDHQPQSYQVAPSVDMLRGSHELKWGGEVRVHRWPSSSRAFRPASSLSAGSEPRRLLGPEVATRWPPS